MNFKVIVIKMTDALLLQNQLEADHTRNASLSFLHPAGVL